MSEAEKNDNNFLGNDGGRTKYLTFNLADEKYGLPLSSVKEIIGMVDITPVPQVPKFFKGLINLRGKIISVIDLRIKLAISAGEIEPKKTSIVITDIEDVVIGVIVDDVEAVVGFHDEQINSTVEIQSKVSNEYVSGIAKTDNQKLCLLLDISKVLSLEELNMITSKAKI
ncbi:MAG: purine-binding chemotaxis protein CheW [Bacteriovoracaceae bacterium]|nr:purine-binding chemotaxis protein CheW [Bacteriovoracaceae bacterium]